MYNIFEAIFPNIQFTSVAILMYKKERKHANNSESSISLQCIKIPSNHKISGLAR